MSFLGPIKWYHSHADSIWPDGTFNPCIPQRKRYIFCHSKSFFLAHFQILVINQSKTCSAPLPIPLPESGPLKVKICQTGLLKLNFEIIPTNAFAGFCQKFSQAMDEVENFLPNFQILWPLGCQVQVVIPQNVKKVKSLQPNMYAYTLSFAH